MSARRPRLTVIIPTFNEETTIRDCLESVGFADEILVVDSHSTDATVSIAREAGARVLQHEYVYSARQKNWAIPQASHEWSSSWTRTSASLPGCATRSSICLRRLRGTTVTGSFAPIIFWDGASGTAAGEPTG